jgi:mannonate dehydratase
MSVCRPGFFFYVTSPFMAGVLGARLQGGNPPWYSSIVDSPFNFLLMFPTWRWYGPKDPISIAEIKATGARGIVTALHQIPNGEVWSREEIRQRKKELAGMPWTVVESIPVHEEIKQHGARAQVLCDNYRQCIRNLAAEGVTTVCYNFMPVLDWTRTRLAVPVPGGTTVALYGLDLAAFDLHIFRRPDAAQDYPEEVVRLAGEHYEKMTGADREEVTEVMLKGLPGSEESFTLQNFRAATAPYKSISRQQFKDNLRRFLEAVVPTAEREGVMLTIHPDDPPWSVMGLPRIVSNRDDLTELLEMVDVPNNGLCLCTGSLGSSAENNLPEMAAAFGDRIHFLHFRNVEKGPYGSFRESGHLTGDVDMAAVMRPLLATGRDIPYRPDHGFTLLGDLDRPTNPGYSLYGRMRGLAELEGLRAGLSSS